MTEGLVKLHSRRDIINTFTDLDEMMGKGNGPIMLLSPKQMFEMGQYYEWAKEIVNEEFGEEIELFFGEGVEVPEELAWVVGETQGW